MAFRSLEPSPHRLEVRAELDFKVRDGKTRLTRSFAEPPLQVQRVLYRDESVPDMAFLYQLNSTPGIFQGDSHTIRVKAGPGTRVQLTTPSATKIYAMPYGVAYQTLNCGLGRDSYLEYLPDPLIPFKQARLIQRLKFSQSLGSVLVIGEVVLPGRIANRETFSFNRLERKVAVTGPDGRPIYHEASQLTPLCYSPDRRAVLSADLPITGSLLISAPDHEMGVLGDGLRWTLQDFATSGDRIRISLSQIQYGLSIKALSNRSQLIKTILDTCSAKARRFFQGKRERMNFSPHV